MYIYIYIYVYIVQNIDDEIEIVVEKIVNQSKKKWENA